MNRNGRASTVCIKCGDDREAIANLTTVAEGNGLCFDCVDAILRSWYLALPSPAPRENRAALDAIARGLREDPATQASTRGLVNAVKDLLVYLRDR